MRISDWSSDVCSSDLGGGRLAEVGRLGLSAPASERQADGACAFGGKLEAAGGGHGKAADLRNDGSQAAMALTFLDTGQDGLVVPRLVIDHTVWRKAGLGQRRSKEAGMCEPPQQLAIGARGNPGGGEGRKSVG